MSITGAADGPPFRLGVAIADIVSGMFAAQGVTAALFARERTGRGQEVDIAMLDSVVALLSYQAGIYFATGAAPQRMGNRHPTIVPYETFAASDGDFVLAVGNDDQWRRFCEVAGFDRRRTLRHQSSARRQLRRAPAAARRGAQGPDAGALDRETEGRRRAVRLGSRSARSVHRPADRCARDDRGARSSEGGPAETGRDAAEVLGYAGRDPYAAADARRAHRTDSFHDLGFTADEIAAFRAERVI